MKFIIGKKLGMTSLHEGLSSENVTIITCGPNTVSQVRTVEKDGYAAVQVETAKTARRKFRKEFRPAFFAKGKDEEGATAIVGDVKVGDELSVSSFEVGDIVDVSGVTKAKGFQGVVKRHGFAGAPASHGRKHDMRKPGSIGATFPEHVVKGRRMAGRMGGDRVTVKNLKVVQIDSAKNEIFISGAIPGRRGTLVEITSVK